MNGNYATVLRWDGQEFEETVIEWADAEADEGVAKRLGYMSTPDTYGYEFGVGAQIEVRHRRRGGGAFITLSFDSACTTIIAEDNLAVLTFLERFLPMVESAMRIADMQYAEAERARHERMKGGTFA